MHSGTRSDLLSLSETSLPIFFQLSGNNRILLPIAFATAYIDDEDPLLMNALSFGPVHFGGVICSCMGVNTVGVFWLLCIKMVTN